jgi:hypothetical protein
MKIEKAILLISFIVYESIILFIVYQYKDINFVDIFFSLIISFLLSIITLLIIAAIKWRGKL